MTDRQSSTNYGANNGVDDGGLWPGDAGTLSIDSRRALVRLLQGPLIRAQQHPKIWTAILSDEQALRVRLSDIFLDLVLDVDAGIAFTRMAQSDGKLDVPTVLRTVSLTHIDTVILLHLRTELSLALPGERVIIDRDELRVALEIYRADDDRNEASYLRRFNAAFKRIRDNYHLVSDTETPGRYEVSPVLRHVFDADVIAGIRDEYLLLVKDDAPDNDLNGEAAVNISEETNPVAGIPSDTENSS